MQVCKDCNIEKSLNYFCKDASSKSGYRHYCKVCTKIRRKNYYKVNRELELSRSNDYRLLNKEHSLEQTKCWKRNNRDKIRDYEKNKLKTDVNFKLAKRLRNRLQDALKNNYKVGSAVKDLGCSTQELKSYLESKFQPGMTWENYGERHIDHILPLARFDLTIKEELLKVCHYTNLQPLWAKANLSKGSKIVNS